MIGKYKYLIKVIEDYVVKCPTIDEMKRKLESMDGSDIYYQLMEQSLLNPLEIEEYDRAVNDLLDSEEQGNTENIEKYKDIMFSYERRLFEPLKPLNEVPNIDGIEFKSDDERLLETMGTGLPNSQRTLERKQIAEQEETITVGNLGYETLESLHQYFCGDLGNILDDVDNEHYLNKVTSEGRKRIRGMDKAMNSSDGLLENATLYRGGRLEDIHLRVGDHSKFKRYTSTSFRRDVGESFVDKRNDFLYIIRSPKGTKGICANAESLENKWIEEHEYLLPRNQGFTVLDIDYANNTIEILLDSEE